MKGRGKEKKVNSEYQKMARTLLLCKRFRGFNKCGSIGVIRIRTEKTQMH